MRAEVCMSFLCTCFIGKDVEVAREKEEASMVASGTLHCNFKSVLSNRPLV